MRRFLQDNLLKILLVFVVYLVSLGLCAFIILYVPYWGHRDYLTGLVDQVAAHYAETATLEGADMFTLGAMVYDAEGSRIAWKAPDSVLFVSDSASLFDNCVSGLVPRVLSGKPVVRVSFTKVRHFGVIVLGRPIYHNGQVTHALFLLRDLHDLYDTLLWVCGAYTLFFLGGAVCLFSAIHRRQKYIRMQRDYVANVSHDLKSPISSIRALTETMYERLPENEGDFKRYCGHILRETVALDHTVKDILELSAVQSRQADLSKSRVSLDELFGAILEKYTALCYDMMIEFQVSPQLLQFPPVWTNRKNMARLLDILLNNAVKFVGEDGVISVDGRADAKKLTVCVRDNGPGICRADQSHIFDRFYMGDLSHNAKGSGFLFHHPLEMMHRRLSCGSTGAGRTEGGLPLLSMHGANGNH